MTTIVAGDEDLYLYHQTYLVSPSYCLQYAEDGLMFRRLPSGSTRRIGCLVLGRPLRIADELVDRIPIHFELTGQLSQQHREVTVRNGQHGSSTRIRLRLEPRPNSDAELQWVHQQVCLQKIADYAMVGTGYSVDKTVLFPDINEDNWDREVVSLELTGVHDASAQECPGFPLYDSQERCVPINRDVHLPLGEPVRVAFTLEYDTDTVADHPGIPLQAKIFKIALV